MGLLPLYTLLSLVVFVDIVLVISIYSKKEKHDNYLGTALLLSAFVAVAYTVAPFSKNYAVVSHLYSLYFAGISLMLMFLLKYILYFTNLSGRFKYGKILSSVVWAVIIFDVVVQLLNPFFEISIHYINRPDSLSVWMFKPKPLFEFHLIICYLMIAEIFCALIYRIIRTPTVYKRKYLIVLGGIFGIVVMNGIFLFAQSKNDELFDISVFFYSLIGCFMYWNRYYYSSHGMVSKVRSMIFDEMDKPVLLFDRDGYLAMYNICAEKFVKEIENKEIVTIKKFVEKWQMPEEVLFFMEDFHYQWASTEKDSHSIYRIDVKRLRDKKNRRTIGKLLVMTDTTLEMDLLTGFHSKNAFETFFREKVKPSKLPVGIAICDINRLTSINKNLGDAKGDEAIKHLSKLMKQYFPSNAFFARHEDANLIAVLPNTEPSQLPVYLEKIRNELKDIEGFGQVLEMQSATSAATIEKPDILEAVDVAMFSMRSKKLMDGSSAHSSLLDSLAQTLLESDNTTRAHVERTKQMGERLGKRLCFSDLQQSNLALLCLLHDIGKLGIPLEILNKPGKLNSAEWDVMKSHVEKGYRIAMASSELEEIADLILHHHESWNGKGYPDGLKQEAIPLLSRVIAVVDTYDAMTNDRPYHKAITDYEAREELKRCAGVQFDPSIVAAFLELLEELHPLKDQPVPQNKEKDTSAPRGVKEVFSQAIENENIQAIQYSKYQLGPDFRILNPDEYFTELTGYTSEDLEKYKLTQFDLIPVNDRDAYNKMAQDSLSKHDELYFEHPLVRKDGSLREVVCLGRPYFDSVTHEPRNEVIVFDVSGTNAFGIMQKAERESAARTAERWVHLMRRDSLTGILNHEAFVNDVEVELLKEDQKVVLVLLDVDFFKNYNDSYGHFAGDKLLSLVAVMLETSVKEFGFAGRLGGDEFAAILKLPLDTTKDQINQLVKHCFDIVMNATTSQEKAASISMGAAFLEEQGNFNKLYQEADHALYRAKDRGRRCFSF